jgi:hypothetical protein
LVVQIYFSNFFDFFMLHKLFWELQTYFCFMANTWPRCYNYHMRMLQISLQCCKCFLEQLRILTSWVVYIYMCWLLSEIFPLKDGCSRQEVRICCILLFLLHMRFRMMWCFMYHSNPHRMKLWNVLQ